MADLNQYIEQLQNFDINDVDWDRVGVWPAPIRGILALIAAGLIIFGGYYFIVKDMHRQLAVAERKEVDLKKTFEKKAHEAANLDKYRQQMKKMDESFDALVSRLPSDTEVPGLLDDIDDKGVESRLEIQSIALQNEVSKEFYVELPIKIKVTGGYHEFGAFVSGVAGMPRIVTLHNFTIRKVGGGRGQGLSNSSLSMEIIAKTYRYKAQEG